jgi:hypothetical protein
MENKIYSRKFWMAVALLIAIFAIFIFTTKLDASSFKELVIFLVSAYYAVNYIQKKTDGVAK